MKSSDFIRLATSFIGATVGVIIGGKLLKAFDKTAEEGAARWRS
jgi:hypothetical protein